MKARLTRKARRAFRVAAILGVVVGASGCQDMLFRQDHRITVSSPAQFATVNQPVTVRWSARDFTAPSDGTFAVFLDRDPMPPGASMSYFLVTERTRNVWITSADSLTLRHVDPLAGVNSVDRDHHDLTVVLLDRDGKRIGETTGFTEFTVRE